MLMRSPCSAWMWRAGGEGGFNFWTSETNFMELRMYITPQKDIPTSQFRNDEHLLMRERHYSLVHSGLTLSMITELRKTCNFINEVIVMMAKMNIRARHVIFGMDMIHKHSYTCVKYSLLSQQLQAWGRCVTFRSYSTNIMCTWPSVLHSLKK
jgi:hypothetical protein